MPLQNRVTPFGELIATPARGTLMGNRGCLHDAQQRIRRTFAVKRWIICVLEFKGRHRQVMAPGQYTELFFLDEATALAAGHRPCAECQRARYDLFRAHWAGRGRTLPGADDMDDVLCRLRADGATIIECVKVVREIEAMHLGRAKEIVDASTAWADRFAENDDLRTTAIEGIERENDG